MKKYLLWILALSFAQLSFAQSGGFPSQPTFINVKTSHSAVPYYRWNRTGGGSDEKISQFVNRSAGLNIELCTDLLSCTAAFQITRTGTTAEAFNLTGDVLYLNGNDNAAVDFRLNNNFSSTTNRASKLTTGAAGNVSLQLCGDDFSSCTPWIGTGSRSGNTAGLITLTGTTINAAGNLQENSIDVQTVETGSFTVTVDTGCTTQPSGTANYTKMGSIVHIDFPNLDCTSNATGKTMAAGVIPAAIRPATAQVSCTQILVDNGANMLGQVLIPTSGNAIWSASPTLVGGFTNSGSWSSKGGTTRDMCSYYLN
jgi:hypothetical protein